MKDYLAEGRKSAKAFCREHGIPFAEYGEEIARQYAHDFKRHDELRALAEGQPA